MSAKSGMSGALVARAGRFDWSAIAREYRDFLGDVVGASTRAAA
jgi:hypothetical protein